MPLQLLCYQVTWSLLLEPALGWNTCYQITDRQSKTFIFHWSPHDFYHHPNNCYHYVPITWVTTLLYFRAIYPFWTIIISKWEKTKLELWKLLKVKTYIYSVVRGHADILKWKPKAIIASYLTQKRREEPIIGSGASWIIGTCVQINWAVRCKFSCIFELYT